MKKSIILILIFILVSALVLSSCARPADEGGAGQTPAADVIKIGVFEPITGANAAGGALEVEGVELANSLYPEVLGKKVQLVIVDNKSDKVEAASAAARLVEKEKVVAIIGSWGSSFSMAAGDIVRNAKVPAVAASATNPLVTKGNDYYFRVCFIDPFQGTVMANYAFNTLGAKKAAIIQEVSSDYAVGLAKFFTDSFKGLGGEISGVSNYNTGDQDFTAQLTNISATKPDVIFAPGNFTESALLIKQAKQLGIKIPIIGGDTWETPEFIDIGKDAVEGTVLSSFSTPEKSTTEEAAKFLNAYTSKYNRSPAAVTALSYDAYIMILDAITRAGSLDTQKIRDELAKSANFSGASGIISLDSNGDAVRSADIKIVKNGKFEFLQTIEPTR